MTYVHSYSALSCFDKCAWQFRDRYVLRNKHPDTPEQAAGTATHLALQRRLEDRRPLPPELDRAESLVQSLERRGTPKAEVKLAMTKSFEPCDFWDARAWVRGVLDVDLPLGRATFIGDWKTGKVREDDLQLMICAMLVMVSQPLVAVVHAANLWLREGRPGEQYTFSRLEFPDYAVRLVKRTNEVERAIATGVFPARPSALCRWCPVSECKERRHAYAP